jgi:eukaryotic-like serine/threonine-protein kinase
MPGEAPQETEGRYVIEGTIGSGSYGVVYRVFDRVKKTVHAAKVLEEEVWVPADEPEEEETTISEMALRELSFLKLLADAGTPCVVRLLDFLFELGEHCAPVAVLPLLSGGDLSDAIEDGRLGRPERLAVGIDALTAVAHLHAFQPAILHRDIKPENILLTGRKRGVLADFGFACFEGPPEAPPEGPGERKLRLRRRRKGGSRNLSHSGVLGTMSYLAPEVLRRADQRPSRDLWALGVLLLELGLNRRLDAESDAEAFREIRRLLEALEPPRGGGPLLEVVAAFLRRRPEQRLSACDALKRLKRAGFKVPERLPQDSGGRPPPPPRPEVPEALRRLCLEVLETGVEETQEAASLCARLCPELEPRAVAAVAAKVYEHRARSDEDMITRLGISIEQLEEAQEALLVASGGCLLVPHLRRQLRTFPGH